MTFPYELFSQLSTWLRFRFSATPPTRATSDRPVVYREEDYFPVIPKMADLTRFTARGCAIGVYMGSALGALRSMASYSLSGARYYMGRETEAPCVTSECVLTVVGFGTQEMAVMGAFAGTSVALAAGIVQSFYQGVKYIFFSGLGTRESEVLNELARFVTDEPQLFRLVENFKLIRPILQNDLIDCLIASEGNAYLVARAMYVLKDHISFRMGTLSRSEILQILRLNSLEAVRIAEGILMARSMRPVIKG